MDGRRFDAWTRALTHALPRRGALKAVAGITMAGAATRAALHEAAACTSLEGAACDPEFGCCADAGLACDATGICQIAGGNSCSNVSQTNQCVNAPLADPTCEGKGCKKKKKKKRRKKHHR